MTSVVTTVRITLPAHLRTLGRVNGEVRVEVPGDAPTLEQALDALEASYPMLAGTIRDHGTRQRRAFMRFFACGRDLSHEPASTPLPAEVVSGEDVLMVIGAIAGG